MPVNELEEEIARVRDLAAALRGTVLSDHRVGEVLELDGLHPPLAAATDLDGRELAGPHESVGLGGGDVEDLRDLGEL